MIVPIFDARNSLRVIPEIAHHFVDILAKSLAEEIWGFDNAWKCYQSEMALEKLFYGRYDILPSYASQINS